jgi:hypothetical protein
VIVTDERFEQAIEDLADIPLARFPTRGLKGRCFPGQPPLTERGRHKDRAQYEEGAPSYGGWPVRVRTAAVYQAAPLGLADSRDGWSARSSTQQYAATRGLPSASSFLG